MIVLSVGQLMPELLAAQYPLRFLDMYGSYSVMYISLVFDWIGVGHAAWFIHYSYKYLFGNKTHITDSEGEKPGILKIKSAELLAATGSPDGRSQHGGVSQKENL